MSSNDNHDENQVVAFTTWKTLPLGVVKKIFLLTCIPCHRHYEKCRHLGCGTPYALMLGKVCRVWREVAWSTPELWQWIDITVSRAGYKAPEDAETQLQLLRDWLQRAQNQLLSITVRPEKGYGNYTVSGPTGPVAVVKVLADYSMQWKELNMYCPDECTQVLNAVRGRVPFLESFTVNTSGMIIPGTTLDFLADAPSLRSLDCAAMRLGQEGNIWPRLTRLRAYGRTKEVINVLRFAPNVEYCRLEVLEHSFGSEEQGQLPSDAPTIFLQNLTNLAVRHCSSMKVLSYIAAPSLQRLSVIQDSFPFPFQTLNDFIDRSHCKLRAFGLAVAFPLDVEGLRTLFSKSDTITRLYIGSKKASDFQTLMRKIPKMLDPDFAADEGVLLPNLQIFYYSTVDPVRSEEMVNMIKSRWSQRWPGVEKLRTVRFKETNLKILLDPLKDEIQQGLEVTYDLPYKGEPFE